MRTTFPQSKTWITLSPASTVTCPDRKVKVTPWTTRSHPDNADHPLATDQRPTGVSGVTEVKDTKVSAATLVTMGTTQGRVEVTGEGHAPHLPVATVQGHRPAQGRIVTLEVTSVLTLTSVIWIP